ncbi:MAG TPA: hypothetical protein VGP27_26105 [Mycobacterium sp.]|jgi:hypothetical protein|nr:hypothetical protein [Mycobacterium sp.]
MPLNRTGPHALLLHRTTTVEAVVIDTDDATASLDSPRLRLH